MTAATSSKTCPTCGNDNLCPGKCDGRSVIACVCGYMVDAAPHRETALKLPGLDRGKQSKQVPMLEKDLQRLIVGALQRLGYAVIETGKHHANLSGNTAGCPDLFVSSRRWGGLWQPMEVKPAGRPVRPAQQALVDAGLSVIVHTAQEALSVAAAVNTRMESEEHA
jgi:hypothetical protein